MPPRDAYPDGAPCWADLSAPDLAGAKAFYGPMLGWDFEDMGEEFGHYTMCKVGGRSVAALMPPMPGAEGLPAMWNTYLATSQLNEVFQRVTDAGGTTGMHPHEVPGAGRLAFGFDPTGASFGLWEAHGQIGAELYGEAGAMCWNEVVTSDGLAADTFYAALFPYIQEKLGGDLDYTVWRLPTGDDTPVAGRFATEVDQPFWRVYFAVPYADAAAAKLQELGGDLLAAPFDTPYGRMVPAADPTGAKVTFCQLP